MRPHRSHSLRTLLVLAMLGLCGCAGFDEERHVAPFFSELSIAGGDREIEALGGSLILRRDRETAQTKYFALRPFFSNKIVSPTERFSWILPPLGTYRRTPEEDVFQLLPLLRYTQQYPVGKRATWSVLALPGIYWAKTNDGRIVRAWFPFGGVVERFLSFDRASFVLFPLWARVERGDRVSRHILWPIFCFTSGMGGNAWRVWPFVGVDRHEGRHERWFLLWPIFHWQTNDQLSGNPEHAWMVWPIYGQRRQGASRSWTALWPLFGYSRNPDSGFWAWDGPWPLVAFQQPGSTGQALRERVWPFYSRFEGDGLRSYYYLWPFYNRRFETYTGVTKDTTYLFPFWHAWDKQDDELGRSKWRKLFSVYRSYRADEGDETFYAFPTLNPFYRLEVIDEHYAWIWELYAEQRKGGTIRQRSWLGLWRREKDQDEDRRSLSMLWARRDYSAGGAPVRETSLLLGLIRWRSSPSGSGLLRPAFPGPGWPMTRVPNSLSDNAPDSRINEERN
ncbi:MAG: hypothetical protein O2816_20075 [Planctomycetota bacterium]|nr:hypothetical protein [Planctomycetota bacterium]